MPRRCRSRAGAPGRLLREVARLFLILLAATLLSACAKKLVVYAAPKSQGTFPAVYCDLVRPWPGPNRIALEVAVDTPCETRPGVFVHVFKGDKVLSSRRHGRKLVTCEEPICEGNELQSGSFVRPPTDTTVRVEVHAVCETSEEMQGAASCRIR